MTICKALATGLVLAWAVTPALGKEPLVLEPSSPWRLVHEPDSCTLARGFGQGEKLVMLQLEQFNPAPNYLVTLAGEPFRSSDVTRKLTITFGDKGRPIETVAMSGKTKEDGRPVFLTHVSTAAREPKEGEEVVLLTAAEEAAMDKVRIDLLGRRDVVLATGSMGKPFALMRSCMDDLLKHWGIEPAAPGIEPAALGSRARPATPKDSPGRWLRSGDYPADGLGRGESAWIHFRLTIAEDGSVSGCSIQKVAQRSDFATRTCRLISERARFEPALDGAGQPTTGYYFNTVRWLIQP